MLVNRRESFNTMAIRPNNHIVGDKAIRQISATLIPEEWTISIPDADYGLDMLIEVVDGNKTTGKFFFIQSKGTHNVSVNGHISYSFPVERLKDYSEMKIPVLFVYYSKEENRFWGRWMNTLYDVLTESQKSQHSVELTFTSNNEVTKEYLSEIGTTIDLNITHGINLCYEALSGEKLRLIRWISTVAISELGIPIKINNPLANKELSIQFDGELDKGRIRINNGDDVAVVPMNISSKDFLYYSNIRKEECPDEILNTVLSIAMLSKENDSRIASYILENVNEKNILLFSSKEWQDFIARIPSEDLTVGKVDKLFDIVISKNLDFIFFIIMTLFCNSIRRGDDKLYRYFLKKYIDAANDLETKGHLYYNIANSVKNRDVTEAIRNYRKSKIHFPKYKEMYYWNLEVAGCCYCAERYFFGELFYKKARRLNKDACPPQIGILISDCLVGQGKYTEAQSEERTYVEQIGEANITLAIELKLKVTEYLRNNCIKINNSTYFFNEAISASNSQEFEKAMWFFLIAWRMFDGDIESLSNAFISAYNIGNLNMSALIIGAIKEINPDEGNRYIISNLLSNSKDQTLLEDSVRSLRQLLFG